MGKVIVESGVMKKDNGKVTGNAIPTLGAGLKEKANCGPCGCDDCLGYTTHTNAETGELMIMYIKGDGTGGNPYAVVIKDYDTGLAEVKAFYDARTS